METVIGAYKNNMPSCLLEIVITKLNILKPKTSLVQITLMCVLLDFSKIYEKKLQSLH